MSTHSRRIVLASLTTMTILFGAIQVAATQPPSWGQCSCPISTNPDAGDAQYSTITNASLCVNASGPRPLCRIQVRCLQDGTGPNCKDQAARNWNIHDVQDAINSLTYSTFETQPDLIQAAGEIYEGAFHEASWPGLAQCLEAYLSEEAASENERRIGSWQSTNHGTTCVYTRAGWLHIVIYRLDGQPIYQDFEAVSYQFGPPL